MGLNLAVIRSKIAVYFFWYLCLGEIVENRYSASSAESITNDISVQFSLIPFILPGLV